MSAMKREWDSVFDSGTTIEQKRHGAKVPVVNELSLALPIMVKSQARAMSVSEVAETIETHLTERTSAKPLISHFYAGICRENRFGNKKCDGISQRHQGMDKRCVQSSYAIVNQISSEDFAKGIELVGTTACRSFCATEGLICLNACDGSTFSMEKEHNLVHVPGIFYIDEYCEPSPFTYAEMNVRYPNRNAEQEAFKLTSNAYDCLKTHFGNPSSKVHHADNTTPHSARIAWGPGPWPPQVAKGKGDRQQIWRQERRALDDLGDHMKRHSPVFKEGAARTIIKA